VKGALCLISVGHVDDIKKGVFSWKKFFGGTLGEDDWRSSPRWGPHPLLYLN